jgi:hypothetical protein
LILKAGGDYFVEINVSNETVLPHTAGGNSADFIASRRRRRDREGSMINHYSFDG